MRIAVLSDIHANLPALEACLLDISQQNVDAVFCLGDLVGYNVWPNEVIERIRAERIPTIAGNYDVGIGLASGDCGCAYKTERDRQLGKQSIAYTNAVISEDNRRYLRSLPAHFAFEHRTPEGALWRILLVHGSPRRVNEYLFADRSDDSFRRILEAAKAHMLLCGHTHIPYHRIIEYPDGRSCHVINVGSVGKPKDGDWRACYVILRVACDSNDGCTVEFRRIEYDIDHAARAIKASPLPSEYADMLWQAR